MSKPTFPVHGPKGTAVGDFAIEVTSPAFAGRSMLERQRMVYGAIAHLMKGNAPPVHAVDSLNTRTSSTS